MGIDSTALEILLISQYFLTSWRKAITLGRQQLHRQRAIINHFLDKYNYSNLTNCFECGDFCEKLLSDLGFESVESLDNSAYEGASIIHNMNLPVNGSLHNQYDFIFDGGTIEHIFNIPQVMENIINMLAIGGIFCSITCNNNLSGHGIYQFSPEFFLSALNPKYGMKIHRLYIAEVDGQFHQWKDVNDLGKQLGGRNCASFKGTDREVYILTIAEKISNERASLITDSPNQYSYEYIDWVNLNKN